MMSVYELRLASAAEADMKVSEVRRRMEELLALRKNQQLMDTEHTVGVRVPRSALHYSVTTSLRCERYCASNFSIRSSSLR